MRGPRIAGRGAGRAGGGTARTAAAGRFISAVFGLVAAGFTLGLAQLVSGLLGRPVAPQLVVGSAAIDRTPEWLKEFAIRTFGQNDKKVLLGGVLFVVLALSAGLGLVGRRHRRAAVLGVALLGLVAAAAALSRPQSRPLDVLPSLLGAAVGGGVLWLLLWPAADQQPERHPAAPAGAGAGAGAGAEAGSVEAGVLATPARVATRRQVVTGGVAAAAGAGAAQLGGTRLLAARQDVEASRKALRLPVPEDPAPPLAAALTVPGISPFFTSNRDFYRVDTALTVPRLTTDAWRLRVHGMVQRELDLDFAALLRRPVVERDITMTCVSNDIGGQLLGTARWLGTPLAALLREAGVRSGASQLVSRSIDGMTIGTALDSVLDGRDALLVYGMNGEPLLPEHGFPVRMVVPGLYGYVSATKWVVDLEVSTFEAFDAYWVKRGWAARAAIRTSSRIDTPKPLARLRPGRVAVAGVAWAQHRGISAVEVSVDGGAWQQARLPGGNSKDLWRQWVWEWDATPGSHSLRVRATDGAGKVQDEQRRTPFPSGSSGWQSIVVTVLDS